jgi:hypothetical protein
MSHITNIISKPNIDLSMNISNKSFIVKKETTNSKDTLVIGKNEKKYTDLSEYKNLALSALALGAILIVGSILAFSLGQLTLSSIFTYTSLSSASLGSIFFIVKHFFTPLKYLEWQRKKIKNLSFREILKEDFKKIESLDLLKNICVEKSLNSNQKTNLYLNLRNLKRTFEELKLLKIKYLKNLKNEYLQKMDDLDRWKINEINKIYMQKSSKDKNIMKFDLDEIDRVYLEKKDQLNSLKNQIKKGIEDNYASAIDQLEVDYQKSLNSSNWVSKSVFSNLAFWK